MQTSRAAVVGAVVTAGAASLLGPRLLRAQDAVRSDSGRRIGVALPAGTEVRVRGRDLSLERGPLTVVEQRGDTLVLRSRDGMPTWVPLDWVTSLEAADGRISRAAAVRRGARTGAILGGIPSAVLLGAAVGYDIQYRKDECSEFCIPATPIAAIVGVTVTTLTTLVGTAVGAAVPRGQRWRAVPLPVHVGATPTRGGGTAFAVSVRF